MDSQWRDVLCFPKSDYCINHTEVWPHIRNNVMPRLQSNHTNRRVRSRIETIVTHPIKPLQFDYQLKDTKPSVVPEYEQSSLILSNNHFGWRNWGCRCCLLVMVYRMISTMRRGEGRPANDAELVSDCSLVEVTLKQRVDNVRVVSIRPMNSLTAQEHKSEPKFITIQIPILYANQLTLHLAQQ
jgi:hypothetical protein